MKKRQLEKLVKRFASGDEAAFDALYDATKTGVYYTILSITKDPNSAEDIMQDTYLKMIESLPKYQSNDTFQAWLNTIARHLALNYYKRHQKEVQMDINENENFFGTSKDDVYQSALIKELLTYLTEDEREIVIRHVIHKEKHKDIARVMNKPLGTITWAYQQALKKMRTLGGDTHEEK